MADLVGGLMLVANEPLRLANAADEAATAIQFQVDATGKLTINTASHAEVLVNYGLEVGGALLADGDITALGNASVTGNVGIGALAGTAVRLTLAAGSASLAPLAFNAGTLLTLPTDGRVEYDGSAYYATVGTDRQQFIRGTSGGATISYATLPTGGGTWANGGGLTFTGGGISIPSGQKFYPDGGGDTYCYESSANVWDFFTGGGSRLQLSSVQVKIGDGTGSQFLHIDGAAASTKAIRLLTAGLRRWQISATDAETGSNVGSNMVWAAYDDSGVLIDEMMRVNRVAGSAIVSQRPFQSISTLTAGENGVGGHSGILELRAPSSFGGSLQFYRNNSHRFDIQYTSSDVLSFVDATGSTTRWSLALTGDIGIVSGAKHYWDGVARNGDTYTYESASNVLDTFVGGVNTLRLTSAGALVTGALGVTGVTTLATGLTGVLRADAGVVSVSAGVGARSIFDHFADANNGTTVETDLYSDTLAAGRLGANGEKVVAQYGGTFVGDATSSQRIRVYFGGTLIFDSGAIGVGVTALDWDIKVTIIRESASVVRCSTSMASDVSALGGDAKYTKVTGLTLANTQILKITGQAAGATAASNQITASEGYVEWLPAAA